LYSTLKKPKHDHVETQSIMFLILS